MLAEIIAALLIGILFGTITGLIPGIHINLISAFLISLSTTLLLEINPLFIAVFVASMAITHTFIDFIPTMFLGCPDTSTELSVLPGHDLLKQGQGYQAIMLTAYGSIAAIILLILISYPSLQIFDKIYQSIEGVMQWILIGISLIIISLERNTLKAFGVFLLTGTLGYFVLNSPNLEQPLLPLLTGLFGSSMIIKSIKTNPDIPEQKIEKPRTKFSKPLIGSLISSPLCSFLPGIGSGQAAILGQTISNPKNKDDKGSFLVLLGATNTLVMGFSFITLYLISKTRTGSANAINQILGSMSIEMLTILLASISIAGILAFFLTEKLAKISSKNIHKINYTKISLITLGILLTVNIAISGTNGLLVLSVSTLVGYYCVSLDIRKTNMMGCLLIPTIILYFGMG
ncbi:MAG: tripartite tricarboxylate transporter permease [Candidatus Pacearchaeota archaeon]